MSSEVVTPLGTPPRVWGKRNFHRLQNAIIRYTPTCVGKTYIGGSTTLADKVHPHVCGENALEQAVDLWDKGTPPRVWGKLCI